MNRVSAITRFHSEFNEQMSTAERKTRLKVVYGFFFINTRAMELLAPIYLSFLGFSIQINY